MKAKKLAGAGAILFAVLGTLAFAAGRVFESLLIRQAAQMLPAGMEQEFPHAASIGIIGGADGPTAIFVSGSLSGGSLAGIFWGLSVACLGLWLLLRRRNR